MKNNYDKLIGLLKELFQFDRADLDFGIFRIMNQKRDEISAFLEKDLLPQVEKAFSEHQVADVINFEEKLKKTIKHAKEAGYDPEESPKIKELREKILSYGVDVKALENEVFSHLYNFFRRYYHEGDFLSLRRYKEGVYAIPYEGEEVKLYWANHDQYYIKSSEYLRDYAFKLPTGKPVYFKLIDADIEKDNVKAQNGKERRFILFEENPVEEIDGELVIRFEYRPDVEKRNQANLIKQAVETVLNQKEIEQWIKELSDLMPTEKNKNRTLLEKYLTDYTARNTFDYFIHKDLGGFLSRELDFYIKNEVMHLDDIENETVPHVEQYLSKINVIRKIAGKIIAFLEQLENFQKKLWLKKKFVVETNYCVTLDRVPEQLYEEIAANVAQREEWVRLFAIDEIEGEIGAEGYSEALSTRFLKENKFLVVDTKFFGENFKKKLLRSFEDLDAECDGLLVHSDNFQALTFFQKRYSNKIECIYTDPPFNTSENTFLYKNNYKHSSWCSMVFNIIETSKCYLSTKGVFGIAIDDLELHYLGTICDESFGLDKRMGILVVEIKPSGRTNDNYLATSHEYYLFYGNSPTSTDINFLELTEEQKKQYSYKDEKGAYKWRDFLRTGGYSTPEERPNSYYPIYYNEIKNEISLEKRKNYIEILPIDSEGKKRVWRKTPPSFLKHLTANEINITCNKAGKFSVQIIDRIKSGTRPKSVWTGKQYDASSHGTKLLKSMFGEVRTFSFPKSLYATQEVINIVCGHKPKCVILDYFAGSGTTAHAVINHNREDNGSRKYILVEMGDYFNTVLIPRIQKVIYSKDWKNGKPVSREGSSHMFKYICLESYEDTLNNLELKRTDKQEQLLLSDAMSKKAKEEYMLSYMLDVESKGSLLNINTFNDPFNYKLNIATGSVGETKPTKVDMVETFNYLIGLTVKHIDHIQGFCVVEGTNPKEEKVLVIWRNIKEKSNKALETFFRKQDYSTRDMEFDLIYVNGDNNLENIRRPDETWKVRLIEEEFKRLMFDVEDV